MRRVLSEGDTCRVRLYFMGEFSEAGAIVLMVLPPDEGLQTYFMLVESGAKLTTTAYVGESDILA